MKDLILNLKGEYFDKIEAGIKPEEFRKVTPFWTARLFDAKTGRAKQFRNVIL